MSADAWRLDEYRYNIQQPSNHLIYAGFDAIDSACGNAGDSLALSVKVEAQYLPKQADIAWYDKATEKTVWRF